jgi:hypothetical protein
MYYHGIFGSVFPLIGVIIFTYLFTEPSIWTAFVYPSSAGYIWLSAASCLETVGVATNIVAFQTEETAFISLLTYQSLIWAFLSDVIIFQVEF